MHNIVAHDLNFHIDTAIIKVSGDRLKSGSIEKTRSIIPIYYEYMLPLQHATYLISFLICFFVGGCLFKIQSSVYSALNYVYPLYDKRHFICIQCRRMTNTINPDILLIQFLFTSNWYEEEASFRQLNQIYRAKKLTNNHQLV